MEHAQIGNDVADSLVDGIDVKSGQDAVLVSSNHGCRMHIKAALQRKGMEMAVAHPIELFSRHATGLANG